MTLTLTVNGRTIKVAVHPMARLLDILREEIGLTGTKEGCGEGECGACTVLMNGVPVLACLTPACQVDGAEVVTVEGLAKETLHPIQQAFLEEGGAQCGICTPGMLISAFYYLEHPECAENLREALAGNQCRCTGYTKIFSSVRKAAERLGKTIPEV
ncbi:MAG: (2Fe-2S)-binding protein [Candidatus Hydrogenedentota bacterium]|nr:MAG: (2Fe-2S)-binding protein [Candidatus Hydrogenedentota bacterium]